METITCLWVQSELDEMSTNCIKSWIKLGYHVDLYTYSQGFTNNISTTNLHILNARSVFNPGGGDIPEPYTHLADEFRFNLFKRNKDEDKETIIWMDTDILLLKKIPTHYNYVSSQYTQQTGAFKCKQKVIANIGVMCLNGEENIDYNKILDCKNKDKVYQSKYLKQYEKQLNQLPDLVVEPTYFCPIHWAWVKDLYVHKRFLKQKKYGILQLQLEDILQEPEIYGVHLWRALKKGKGIQPVDCSIYHQLLNHLDL